MNLKNFKCIEMPGFNAKVYPELGLLFFKADGDKEFNRVSFTLLLDGGMITYDTDLEIKEDDTKPQNLTHTKMYNASHPFVKKYKDLLINTEFEAEVLGAKPK